MKFGKGFENILFLDLERRAREERESKLREAAITERERKISTLKEKEAKIDNIHSEDGKKTSYLFNNISSLITPKIPSNHFWQARGHQRLQKLYFVANLKYLGLIFSKSCRISYQFLTCFKLLKNAPWHSCFL